MEKETEIIKKEDDIYEMLNTESLDEMVSSLESDGEAEDEDHVFGIDENVGSYNTVKENENDSISDILGFWKTDSEVLRQIKYILIQHKSAFESIIKFDTFLVLKKDDVLKEYEEINNQIEIINKSLEKKS